MFSEDLIKYIWSLEYCSTTFEKRDKNYKTKKNIFDSNFILVIDFWVEIRVRVPNFYKKDSFTFLLLHYL